MSTSPKDAARRAVKSALLRAGVEIGRHRPSSSASRRSQVMAHHRIGVVLDVGGNLGSYGRRLREAGYVGRIVSFEPVGHAFAGLAEQAAGDPRWHVHRLALGAQDDELEINVAEGVWCSSFLPLAEHAENKVDGMTMVTTEKVPVRRLDGLGLDLAAPTMMKLDVQGFEPQVIDGAGALIDQVTVIEIELSLALLYEGQTHGLDMAVGLRSRGFELVGVDPGAVDPATGYVLEADALFARVS
jgi:FkbM family methyltransferase